MPFIIAHRGARLLAPENTLEAADIAYQCGADMWELDVQYTADRKLIIVHDETLERTTDIHLFPEYKNRKPWRVSEFTKEELNPLNFGYAFDNSKKVNAPFLEDAVVFSQQKGIEMNVEIKDLKGLPGHANIAAHVYETIKRNHFLPHVLFSSFNIDYLFEIRKRDPHARIAILVDRLPKNYFSAISEINAEAFHPHKDITDEALIIKLQERLVRVNVWTVNEKAEMLQFLEMGIDGIITDNPGLLKNMASDETNTLQSGQ